MWQHGKILTFILVLSLLAAPSLADPEKADLSDPDIVAESYADGDMLLMLGGSDFELRDEVRLFDLSGASPEKRAQVIQDFLDGVYDGVFLGAPEDIKSKESCGSLSDCAKDVKRICKAVGSKANYVNIIQGCSGTCEDGMQVSVTCASPDSKR
jgi:hypothetical protein